MTLWRIRRPVVGMIDAVAGEGTGARLSAAALRMSRGMDPAVITPADVMRRETVESLVAGADEYYKSAIAEGAASFLKRKPFHAFDDSPQVLVRLGCLLHGARLAIGMRVVEYGGGAGWLSALLFQMGCHVTCVDASDAALRIAREAFDERRSLAVWDGATATTALTDGHTLPVADDTVDRVICYDVFHHVPNQKEVLRGFFRVLKPGGMACFCEPGRYHSMTVTAQDEMANYRVLENDVVLEDVWALARSVGFTGIVVYPMLDASYTLSIDDYLSFVGSGRAGVRGREALMNGTLATSVFFLQKGTPALDSRHASALSATIAAPATVAAKAGVPVTVTVAFANSGEGRWLSHTGEAGAIGTVNIGIMRGDESGRTVERDWRRVPLPHDVEPGQSIEVACEIMFPEAGSVTLRVDLVSEHIKWFGAASDPIAVNVA
jgi:2-polyprenyl-3-methyl-5-hydroxy-6-metoxy-1,4-benzoquinol methylase